MGQFGKARYLASRCALMHHTFFGGFIDSGLGFFELHIQRLAAACRYGLAYIFYDAFYARFNGTVANTPDFILARTFNC